jgi:hypothetical protein
VAGGVAAVTPGVQVLTALLGALHQAQGTTGVARCRVWVFI